MSATPMTQEELDAIQMRLGCDNSTTDDVCTLLDEVERLRALTTVDDAMVERAAWAMCDDVHGTGPWDDMPNVARPIWRQTARAALNAALGTGDEA